MPIRSLHQRPSADETGQILLSPFLSRAPDGVVGWAVFHELLYIARRLALGGPERIELGGLPDDVGARFLRRRSGLPEPTPAAPVDEADAAESLTEAQLKAVLAAAKGNVSRAARALGVGRKTVYRRLQAWDIDPEGFRSA